MPVAATSASDLVRRTATVCAQYRRQDLVARLAHTSRRLSDPTVRVLVVGEFKQGKSLLINALVGAPICPVDDDLATSVPLEVGYGERPRAALLLAPSATASSLDASVKEEPVELDALAATLMSSAERSDGMTLVGARASLPRPLLKDGLVLVDTPGVGGLASSHSANTVAALPSADAVILVSDASSEFTSPEVTFLRQALSACPTVLCVLSKTDLYPQWRRVLEIDQGHLGRLDLRLPTMAISSNLRLAAVTHNDTSLNDESGFPGLVRYLHTEVLGRREQLTLRSTAHDVTNVVGNLRLTLASERDALQDPKAIPEMVRKLNEARGQADELKRRSSRWQSTLSDGVADLNADLDHDLRDRVRLVVREAEEAIDARDPGTSWEEFALWFEQRISAAVADTFLWAESNAGWLVDQVGQHFSEDSQTLSPEFHLDDTSGVVDPVHALGNLDSDRLNTLQKMLVGLRGSYGGILMFGLLTGLVGIPLVNPLSVGAGLLLGGKAYRDDADTRLKRRRAEAKMMVRRYADDVNFYVSKQLKDRLRVVQRMVRDHYGDVAEELSRSLRDSVANAQKAAAASATDREKRLTVVRQALADLDALTQAAQQLTRQTPQSSPGSPGSPGPQGGQRPAGPQGPRGPQNAQGTSRPTPRPAPQPPSVGQPAPAPAPAPTPAPVAR